MNALDDLLASTGRVEDITSDGLRNGRAALESTIDYARAQQAPASAPARPAAPERFAGLRGKIIVACTAAAVAAVAVIVVPRLSSQRPAPGHPSAAQSAAVTAAVVFREAAKAVKAAGVPQEGWPHAAFWRADSIEVRDGNTYHRDIWIARNGDAVLEDGSLAPGLQRVSPAGSGFGYLGNRPGWLTWDEIYALPTDPARLASVLKRDSVGGVYASQAKNLWAIVLGLLVETPASPALREALYNVAANIPGVAVNGDYTDSLGRTGTALRLGVETLVIDPANGQLLAWIDADVAYTYTFQGPVTSAP
jgi:hypothetical protein